MVRFILEKDNQKFRVLTRAEITEHAASIAGQIVAMVRKDVVERFATPEGEPEITSTDAMQVAVTAMAAAEGILATEALEQGLPVENILDIRNQVFVNAFRRKA